MGSTTETAPGTHLGQVLPPGELVDPESSETGWHAVAASRWTPRASAWRRRAEPRAGPEFGAGLPGEATDLCRSHNDNRRRGDAVGCCSTVTAAPSDDIGSL